MIICPISGGGNRDNNAGFFVSLSAKHPSSILIAFAEELIYLPQTGIQRQVKSPRAVCFNIQSGVAFDYLKCGWPNLDTLQIQSIHQIPSI